MTTLRGLCEFAADLARFPIRFVQAVGEGVALGWEISHLPDEIDPT